MRYFAIFFALLLAPIAAIRAAELKFAGVFTDHAVLQRGVAVPIWGWADPGLEIVVEFAGQKKTTTADAAGKWLVKLDPLEASAKSRSLTATAPANKSSAAINDLLVGEVWLGSGQSNMAFLVKNALNAEQEQAAADLPSVRMYRQDSPAAKTVQADGKGEWVVCTPQTVGVFSATLFFFGREIHKALGVPVGLINSSVGGTPIESWIAAEAQSKSPELATALADAAKESEAVPSDEVKRKYESALAQWAEAAKAARAANRRVPRKPVDPAVVAERKGNVGGLFNGKIAPLIPYAIRGAIWYQGEANSAPDKAPRYQYQLPLLVKDWRERWGYEFPFAWAQLPNFGGPGRDWPTIREAMLKTLALPKTGMGINIDIGEEKNIHPKNKQEVGRRLSLWALGTVYEQSVASTSGPLPAAHEIRGSEMVLGFSHADGGLVAKGEVLKGFTVAGEDCVWKPAQARIEGGKVIVSNAEVPHPVAARYAWENFPDCNLYNGAGLPASPFRTDDWK